MQQPPLPLPIPPPIQQIPIAQAIPIIDLERILLGVHSQTVAIYCRLFSVRVRTLLEYFCLLNAFAMLLILVSFHSRFIGKVTIFIHTSIH